MKRAIELAVENARSARGGPFAAIVVSQGKVIAEGTNLVTSSNDPTAHAEVVAIRRACDALGTFRLTGCEIYTSCEPCPMCLGAIYWAHPAAVYYSATKIDASAAGFDDSLIYEQIGLPIEHRGIPMRQLLRENANDAFEAWRQTEDRVPY